jgi:AAA domain
VSDHDELAARIASGEFDLNGQTDQAELETPRLLVWEHAPDPFIIPAIEWKVTGLWCTDTHGELAGGEKTLKSYVGMILDVGLAAGVPVFGRFPVPQPGRILNLVGEGGRLGYWRRFGRVCDAYGIDAADVRPNLRVTFNTAHINSVFFEEELRAELGTYGPGLTHLDPWYAYAPTQVDSARLVEVGTALEAFGRLCAQGGSSSLINNHFNQTGVGNGLTRITGAGHAEWSDSWLLVRHREPPNVTAGKFRLRLDVGSRQWGGTSWDLDLDIGRFDVPTGQHDGPITWNIQPASTDLAAADAQDTKDAKVLAAKVNVLRVARRRKRPFTKTGLLKEVGGNAEDKSAAFDQLVEQATFVPAGTTGVSFGSGTRQVTTFEMISGA